MWIGARARTMGFAVDARRKTLTLLVCCSAQFLGVLDMSVVNVALPPIRADLGFSTAGLQWVVNAYALACAGCLLLGGRAADLFGRREVFVGGVALFGLASLAGGLAQDQATLVAARAAQGVGGAVMAPTSLSILATIYDAGPQRNRAFGLWGTMGALGGASGALVGGLLTATLSWRWILLVNAPLTLAMALVALRAIPPLGRRRAGAPSFDLPGALTVTAGLVLVTYGIVGTHRHGWGASATLGPIAAGAALLALFGLIEGRFAAAPLVPPRLFRSRALAGAAATVFCLGAAAVPMWFFLSLYLQRSLGYSALEAGLAFAPMSVVIAACTQTASRLAARVGAGRVLAAGMTLLGAGMLLLARTDSGLGVLLPSLLCAAGIGCSFVSTTITATAALPAGDSGLASGLVNTSFQSGGSIGLAVLAAVAGGSAAAFALAGGAALAGAAVAVTVLAPRRHPAERTRRRRDPRCPAPSARDPERA
jgi:EmrB/QacA subfamily drug resistance transporter